MNETIETLSKKIKKEYDFNNINNVCNIINIELKLNPFIQSLVKFENKIYLFYRNDKEIIFQLSIYFLYNTNNIKTIDYFSLNKEEIYKVNYLFRCLLINDNELLNLYKEYYGKPIVFINKISNKLNINIEYIIQRLEDLNLVFDYDINKKPV